MHLACDSAILLNISPNEPCTEYLNRLFASLSSFVNCIFNETSIKFFYIAAHSQCLYNAGLLIKKQTSKCKIILGYNSEIECLYIKAPEFEPQVCKNKQTHK